MRARIIIEGYLAAFQTSTEPYLYIVGEANFDDHKGYQIAVPLTFAELARFEMISKPKIAALLPHPTGVEYDEEITVAIVRPREHGQVDPNLYLVETAIFLSH